MTYDVAVVGAGHNGLAAAAYCARAGLRTIVLERDDALGGATRTADLWPGYRVSVASYVVSLLDETVVQELDLRAHGYAAYRKDPASFTPLADGRSLLLGADAAANAREIAAFDPADVAGYHAFEAEAERLGAALAATFHDAQPSWSRIDPADAATLRGSAAELVERYVRTPVLAATLATDGLIGTDAGPRDPGTAYVLAHHYAGRAVGVRGAWGFVRGGMGAVSGALASAARAAGAELRTAAPVTRIAVDAGRVGHVELAGGATVRAHAVLVGADPRTLFERLLAPGDVPPEAAARLRTWRQRGVSAKLNLALSELPDFRARPGTSERPHHRATIHVAASIDALQAAYDETRDGRWSSAPLLECFCQTPTDPSMAPAGKHVLSIFAQWFPYDLDWTGNARQAAAEHIVRTLARYAPNVPDAIEHLQFLAPPDIEAQIGITGGQIFHGELLPGQLFEERFPVRTGIAGLYLCGSGTHPGGCVTAVPGRRAALAALADRAAVGTGGSV